MTEFFQEAPGYSNRFESDRALRGALEHFLGEDAFREAEGPLKQLGELASGDLLELQEAAEKSPPRHVPFDAWGRRVDVIEVHPSWLKLVDIGHEAGLVAVPYEQGFGAKARILQAGLLHLFLPCTATADCPLGMTDAAVTVLNKHDSELAATYIPKLTARTEAWSAGQWMTEREGGSDVSRTSTKAVQDSDGAWRLTGTKWFTSAATSQIALALARPEGVEEGSAGLSLFLVELHKADGSWNGIRVRRLKDKLGTRALPTAELELEGAVAVPVGGIGRGVAKIAPMLNVTRLHAALGANSYAGLGLSLSASYAKRRVAYGRPLRELPVHRVWMAELGADYRAGLLLCLRAAELIGKSEHGDSSKLARLVVPLTKLAAARQGVEITSHVLESFGGAGYVEDTGIPRLLRDVHVQCIWEGTTSVMALDVRRALAKEGAGAELVEDAKALISNPPAGTEGFARRIEGALADLTSLMGSFEEAKSRVVAWGLARTYQAALLFDAARWGRAREDDSWLTALELFMNRPLVSPYPGSDDSALDRLAFESF
ncbi:MAG TPA: acyl-CoA dehydrogenase family protein [Actinomycetota bacterium]|nr:acyl-CoA dehydrogenase family protein [Actinomycetota bacterium]